MTASGRNGFEIYLLVLTGAWAVVSWVTGEGETVAAIFTPAGRHVWLAGLVVSSVLALAGITLGTYTGMQLERAALFLLAGFLACVAVAFVGFATRLDALHLLYVTPMLLGAAGVALSRTRQLRQDLYRIRQRLTSPPEVT